MSRKPNRVVQYKIANHLNTGHGIVRGERQFAYIFRFIRKTQKNITFLYGNAII